MTGGPHEVGPSAWSPTHAVPEGGLPAWPQPDPALPPATQLAAAVQLQVVERTGDWARVAYSNGWMGWVDARRLVPLGAPAAVPAPTMGVVRSPIVAAAGAGLVIVGSFLPWYSSGGVSLSGWELPVEALFTNQQSFGLKVGLVLLLVLLALLPLVTRRPLPTAAAVAIAGLPVGIAALAFKLWLRLNPRPGIGVGFILVLGGGLLVAYDAVLAGRAKAAKQVAAP